MQWFWYNVFAMKRPDSIKKLAAEVDRIKAELMKLGDLQPGGMTRQYKTCGNPNCCCHADPPKKHGPYYQLSFTRNGKGGTRFVKAVNVRMVKDQIKNFERLRELVDRWIDLSTRVCTMKIEENARRETGRKRA